MANSFFKNGDKAYSENLNDGILVGNAFDWTVSIGLPADNEGVFPNSSTVVKAKVADLSITPNSNLSIGSTISNSSGSSQVYRLTVYPAFNRFGGFQSITLTGDGTFYIANKGGTSPIASNLDYTDLSDVPELKVLKEYDIVVTIPNNGEVTGLEFVLQSSSADVSASISQANVTGLGNIITTIQEKDTAQDNRLSSLENVDAQIFNYNLYSSSYNPTIDSNITISCRVQTVTGEDVEGETVTLYQNGSSIGTATTDSSGVATWTVTCDEWGLQDFRVENQSIQVNVTGFKQIATYADGFYTLSVDGSKRLAKLRVSISSTNIATGESYKQTGFVSSTYRPNGQIISIINQSQNVEVLITNAGNVSVYNPTGSAVSSFTGTTIAYWDY